MQPRRKPSTDVNNIGDNGLLRQVLTRNLLTVTFDPPELEEQPKHLNNESMLFKKRESCRQTHFNPGYFVKSDGSRDEQCPSCSSSCMSSLSKRNRSPVGSRSRCTSCDGTDDCASCISCLNKHSPVGSKSRCTGCSKPSVYACSSPRPSSFLESDENRLSSNSKIQVGSSSTDASKSHRNFPSKDKVEQRFDTVDVDNTDPNDQLNHTSYDKDDNYDCSCSCFTTVDGKSTVGLPSDYIRPHSGSNYSLEEQACCLESNSQPLSKYQKTEDYPNISDFCSARNTDNTKDYETPTDHRSRSISASTAFSFPSPIFPRPSTSDTQQWTPDHKPAGALCSTFSRLVSSDGDAEETLPVPFSSIENIKDAVSAPALPSPPDSRQYIMAPKQELPSPLNQRNSFPLSPSSVKDFSVHENADDDSPICDMHCGHFRRSSDMHIKAASEMGRRVTPRLIQRTDLTFGPVIGKGGFGRVHKGELHGLPVAIKVVQKRRGSGIHREILQAERLAFSLRLRHANIVHILGVNVCDDLRGEALIIMELVSSRTLQALLDDDNTVISLDERLRFGIEVCSALRYLHSYHLVHLDVKPQNVLLGDHARCKLADFGNLTRTRPGLPREDTDFTQLLGTLPYRAPELMKGQFPSCKADIYSLGITLWQMASRQMPHSGANPHWLIYQVTKNDARPISHCTGSDVTETRYCGLYEACWDAQPGSRPPAEEVERILVELREEAWQCGCEELGSFTGRLG